MDYVLLEWDHDLDDEPYLVYSELDEKRMERRKVEFFRGEIGRASCRERVCQYV